jgi:hypothetical protein
MNLKPMKFLVMREEFPAKLFCLISADVEEQAITTDEELLLELRAGVEQWVRQLLRGRDVYDYAGSDMNVGDLLLEDIDSIVRFCPNIQTLRLERVDLSESWNYDTSLCGDLEDGP